ncbi:hypothetical protein Tco_1410858 [Tanacetum coccineum]
MSMGPNLNVDDDGYYGIKKVGKGCNDSVWLLKSVKAKDDPKNKEDPKNKASTSKEASTSKSGDTVKMYVLNDLDVGSSHIAQEDTVPKVNTQMANA